MKTITVPAAGEHKEISLSGLSVKVLSAESFQDPFNDAARLSFNQAGANLPAVAGAAYPFGDCDFEKIVVTGTPESAGTEITLLAVPICLDLFIPDSIQVQKSIAGETSTKQASDNVQGFSELELMDSENRLPKSLYLWVVGGATRGINYAYNADPSQGYQATDAAYWDNDPDHDPAELQQLEILGIDWILSFNFIATAAGETPTVVYTPRY